MSVRRAPVFAVVLALLASSALVPAANGQTTAAECRPVTLDSLEESLATADIVVLGNTVRGSDDESLVLRPAVFFKSPAESADLPLLPGGDQPCPPAALRSGQRLIVFGTTAPGGLLWPREDAVVLLVDGRALLPGAEPGISEQDFVSALRDETGQYAVPAPSRSPAIDLQRVVLPVVLAMVALFAIGLVLMRIWHRIDPS
ncbi:MAG: hypothetical protein ACE5EF_07450 [Dehalococcoidia bacterium]